MSTQAASAGTVTAVVAADTLITNGLSEVNEAVLPAIDDGTGGSVAVGTEIRFEATAGGGFEIIDADGRLVGRLPGYGQGVVIAQRGANESMDDYWTLREIDQTLAAHQATPTAQQCWDVLRDLGFVKAE